MFTLLNCLVCPPSSPLYPIQNIYKHTSSSPLPSLYNPPYNITHKPILNATTSPRTQLHTATPTRQQTQTHPQQHPAKLTPTRSTSPTTPQHNNSTPHPNAKARVHGNRIGTPQTPRQRSAAGGVPPQLMS